MKCKKRYLLICLLVLSIEATRGNEIRPNLHKDTDKDSSESYKLNSSLLVNEIAEASRKKSPRIASKNPEDSNVTSDAPELKSADRGSIGNLQHNLAKGKRQIGKVSLTINLPVCK